MEDPPVVLLVIGDLDEQPVLEFPWSPPIAKSAPT
jgi:hypothetical protein